MFWGSLAVCAATVGLSIELWRGARKIRALADRESWDAAEPPRVSIIFSALDEEATIEPALRSLMALDYPNLEIVAIDDRSTDSTGMIIARLASECPKIKAVSVSELPTGWLGKNHALHVGAARASGDYLLFADADAVFEPSAVSRAVGLCEREGADHVALLFDVVAPGPALKMAMVGFFIGFLAKFKPWRVEEPGPHYLGVGGFNLVRRGAYQACGGHAAIPMAILDDMMLGKIVKASGGSQRAPDGRGMVSVEWYPSVGAMAKGLEKNAFAAFGFRVGPLMAASAALLTLRFWPWVGLFAAHGPARWLCALFLLASLGLRAWLLRRRGWSLGCLAWAPLADLLDVAMWWRSAALTLARGGIFWRGTRYDLQALKEGQAGGL